MESVSPTPAEPEVPACRHEYIRIYQRKLKGLERRMVSTKAWLPVGFKPTDFSHLGEGSYCFCSKCRTRLFPKRTNAEKAHAKAALAAEKAQALLALEMGDSGDSDLDLLDADTLDDAPAPTKISVEEMEIESVGLEDLEEGSVNITEAQSSCMTED